MIKIAIVIPYMELLDVYTACAKRLAKGRDIEFKINNIKGTRNNFIKECDADIVVARGITSMALRKELLQAHFIDIEVSGYDIFNAIIECKKKFQCDKIGLILTENVLCDIESLKQISDEKFLTIFKVRDESDILDAFEEGRKQNISAFIGGTTAKKMCDELEIQCVSIKVGVEAIENSVRLAVDTADSIDKERSKTIIMKNVLNNAQNGIIALTKKGKIEEINSVAKEIFDISEKMQNEDININNIFPKEEWKNVIKENISKDIFFKKSNMLYVTNISPLFINKEINGVLFTIHNTEQIRETETKIRTKLRSKGLVAKYNFEDILGDSDVIKKAKNMAKKYSQVNSNVLITGETGTGKELFAHSIHNSSKRNLQPFVAVNCAAVPENLLESELFGYTEGAFTGAVRGGKIGLFELAHGGTIFLDEIGEMPLNLQAKILRVLEEKEIRRVGDDKVIPIDLRIISATNINMQKKISQGEFRSDLYYRLNLLDITVAPLRDRRKDIPILARHFIKQAARKNDMENMEIDENAIIELCKWEWNGNVRELRNICERLVVLSENKYIGKDDLSTLNPEIRIFDSTKTQNGLPHSNEFVYINKADLAKAMGISRTTLWRRTKDRNSIETH